MAGGGGEGGRGRAVSNVKITKVLLRGGGGAVRNVEITKVPPHVRPLTRNPDP